jgi:hypothetical protein
MKTIFIFLSVFFLFSVYSCDELNGLLPGVETDFSETFQIMILANSGTSDSEIIKLESSDEYNDFKGNIDKFEFNKFTYIVKNNNVPDDMYFSGTINCSDEENKESLELGSIDMINISALSDEGNENEVVLNDENVEKVLGWLDSQGNFNIKSEYRIKNSDGTEYLINAENRGSNFELLVKLYVTVKVKV